MSQYLPNQDRYNLFSSFQIVNYKTFGVLNMAYKVVIAIMFFFEQ